MATAAGNAAKPEDDLLLQLRPDIIHADGGFDLSGDHGAILHDPIRHRFFRLSGKARQVLDQWHLGSVAKVVAASGVTKAEVRELADFLRTSRLVTVPFGASAGLLDEKKRSERSLFGKLLHGYLSFRVPLFNPEPILDWGLPFARLLVHRFVLISIVILGLVGFYFAARQWDQFAKTFLDFFSLQGAFLYTTTLVGLKVLHELGHGLVARHYGCRVPAMGVAFMILTPMLYTEASDAWRLSSRWQRFAIGAAGICVELSLAAVALFLWAFLPDGPLRSATYFVAATAWIISLAVNLSPFMRFDGYHMLGDALAMHSLGARSNALANWKLRQLLFAPLEPRPEFLPRGLERLLSLFAYGTWIYRFFLFMGIAWLVYTILPKAVGLPLAVVEVWFFILLPVFRELKEWHAMGIAKLLGTKRGMTSLGVLAAALVLAALPLGQSISVPAVLLPELESSIYPPEPAQIISLHARPGVAVRKGEILARLLVPELGQLQRLAMLRLEIVEERLKRLAADAKVRAQRVVLLQERQAIWVELEGLRQRNLLLAIVAPHDGIVTGWHQELMAGQWVGKEDQVFHLVSADGAVMSGLVAERLVGRLQTGAQAYFVSEDGARRGVMGVLVEIGIPGGQGVAQTYLSAERGGPIAVAPEATGNSNKTLVGQLPLLVRVDDAAPATALRGTATIEAVPQSLLAMAFGRLVTVFLRESGF